MDRLDDTLPLGDVAEGASHPRVNLRIILREKFGAVCSGGFTESCCNHLVPPSRSLTRCNEAGSGGRARTYDLAVNSRPLYH
jgi:hypothetical protein